MVSSLINNFVLVISRKLIEKLRDKDGIIQKTKRKENKKRINGIYGIKFTL